MTLLLSNTPGDIAKAAQLLQQGELVSFATETVYGLGGNACDDQAVAGIFEAKGRPRFNPLIVHFPDSQAAAQEVVFSQTALKLASAFWPGPLTLVLPRRADSRISLLCSAGLDSLAVRVPAPETARTLLRKAGCPVAAPSANRAGKISPTRAAHVMDELSGRIAAVLDDGACKVGVESTVVSLTGERPALLRPGGLAREEIEKLLGSPLDSPCTENPVSSPGMLKSHYAPQAALRLNATSIKPEEAFLAFGDEHEAKGKAHFNLSPAGDLREAAANLFAALRELDRPGISTIAVAPIPDRGLGQAINDRLQRAAAPRDS
ncbi:MAG: L-threonylcarbamoyladenylate synthase [Pseudomonadota bacterium]|uniref:L-threonylcarbamoyladenylate synthase n=1 Tax=Fodinicurvata fenggangensis TaxID=1121830 RepID=UPI00047ACCB7|nr:L-threonylcarbamoyladenylate synthase [Fodinicurvata fenggangensis]